MHRLGFIHRDLKPGNIMMGFGRKSNIVYLIDYGLSKKNVGEVYTGFSANKTPKKMAGTPIYASINAHMATGGNLLIYF
jgi:serine/threonine protein kinase